MAYSSYLTFSNAPESHLIFAIRRMIEPAYYVIHEHDNQPLRLQNLCIISEDWYVYTKLFDNNARNVEYLLPDERINQSSSYCSHVKRCRTTKNEEL